MAPSWPTTTLRTSPLSRSAMLRIRSRSIQDLLFPAIEVLRGLQQKPRLLRAAPRRHVETLPELREFPAHAARLAHPVEPGPKRPLVRLQRRMDAAADLVQHHLAVAL